MFQATQRYQEIETKLSKDVLKIKASLNAMIYYRLFVFFLIPTVLYFFWNINTSLKVLLVAIPVVLFFYLIKKNKQINDQYQLLKTKRDINIDEQEPWNSSSSKFKNGAEFQDPQHPYTYDLDVFGKGSLFQYLNRAESIGGQEKLANWLAKAEKDQDELTARQEAISEMADKIEFRQATQARIRLCEEKKGDLDKLMKWSKEPKKIKINFFHKLLLWLVPVYSFGLLFMLSWDWISVTLFLVLIVLPLTLSAVLLKPLNEEYKTLEKAFKSVSKYGEVFHFLGSTEWNSSKLIRIKEQTNGASESLTSLEKVVSAFDQRINGLVMLFMNIFITWDLRCVLRLYKWKD
ncbi:MAG: hypothetical protein AB8F74_05255, partial [Saprospiraceae bacterium]